MKVGIWIDKRFNCNLCQTKPLLKELNGCTGQSKQPFTFPRADVDYSGERVTITTCPHNVVTDDIWTALITWSRADGKLTVSESELLPGPYLDAWDLISNERQIVKNHETNKAIKGVK